MDKLTYTTNCVGSDANSIDNMRYHDNERMITRNTFLKKVDRESLAELEEGFGYAKHYKQGLTMASDWHVSYHKSFYRGKPCVYIIHSSIEYVFT